MRRNIHPYSVVQKKTLVHGRDVYQTKESILVPTQKIHRMECLLCNIADETVSVVATCSNRCSVAAHPKCWGMRKVGAAWRKKHHDRGNEDSELCMVVGCQGKCKARIPVRAEHAKTVSHITKEETRTVDATLDDPTRPCCFMGRDGLPCRRPAVANNACTRHAREAELMCKMVEKSSAPAPVETPPPTEEKRRVRNSSCQTTEPWDEAEELRKELKEMEYAAHREALRITRLDIKLEADREALEVERGAFLSKSEEDARTIARLQEELARLRQENVTMKRREESIKAKYMSSGRDKKEVVRKIQDFLATL